MAIVLAVVGGLVVAAVSVGVITIVGRICPDPVLAVLQLVLPWTTVLSVVVAVGAEAAGARGLAVAAALVVGAAAVVLLPRLLRTARPPRPGDGPRVTVALANLYLDNPEPEAAVDQLLERDPDVVVLTELTDDLLAAFDRRAAGRYRRRVHPDPLDGEYEPGIFVADRIEVVRCGIERVGSLQWVEAELRIDGRPLRVVTVHPTAPANRADFRTWRTELRELRRALRATEGAMVLLGDLNAGTLQVPYDGLARRTRFRDAHDLMGVALRPSWGIAPGLPRWVPTLVARLDHLLVSPEVTVCELEDLDPVGSDHRPFLATLAVGPV